MDENNKKKISPLREILEYVMGFSIKGLFG
jgi:hypothetical protein